VKRFRRNAEYATDSHVFRSVDRNQRIRIIVSAEALERRTKAKGQKSGVLGLSGLELLRSLLFRFCAIPTGRCCPSYRAINSLTGLADRVQILHGSALSLPLPDSSFDAAYSQAALMTDFRPWASTS
jgi:hypothetical protein